MSLQDLYRADSWSLPLQGGRPSYLRLLRQDTPGTIFFSPTLPYNENMFKDSNRAGLLLGDSLAKNGDRDEDEGNYGTSDFFRVDTAPSPDSLCREQSGILNGANFAFERKVYDPTTNPEVVKANVLQRQQEQQSCFRTGCEQVSSSESSGDRLQMRRQALKLCCAGSEENVGEGRPQELVQLGSILPFTENDGSENSCKNSTCRNSASFSVLKRIEAEASEAEASKQSLETRRPEALCYAPVSSSCKRRNCDLARELLVVDQETASHRRAQASAPNKLGRRRLKRMPCVSCGTLDTPQWRRGLNGERNLCNACGVKFRKGLLRMS